MTVLVRIICGACGRSAGVGFNSAHALANVKANGGRIIKTVSVCSTCAKATL